MIFSEDLSPHQRKKLECQIAAENERAKIELEIVKAYNSGKCCETIADEFHYCKETIANILKHRGVDLAGGHRRTSRMMKRYSPETIEGICNSYKSGVSIGSLQIKYDISYYMIRRILAENGIALRSNNVKVTRRDNDG